MKERRSEKGIFYDVLNIIYNYEGYKIKRTNINRDSNRNYSQTCMDLKKMQEYGLLSDNFYITEKGSRFYNAYENTIKNEKILSDILNEKNESREKDFMKLPKPTIINYIKTIQAW